MLVFDKMRTRLLVALTASLLAPLDAQHANVTTLKSWASNCTSLALPMRVYRNSWNANNLPEVKLLTPTTGAYTTLTTVDGNVPQFVISSSTYREYHLDACGMSPIDSFLYCIWVGDKYGFPYLEERRLVRIGNDGSAEFVAKLPFYSGCNDLDADEGNCEGYVPHRPKSALQSHIGPSLPFKNPTHRPTHLI